MSLIEMLGYNSKMFRPVSMPGTIVGNFTKEIQEEVGFDCTVVLPATHDTGSAVLAVPTNDDNAIYIRLRYMVTDGDRAKRSGLFHGQHAGQLYQ